MNVTRLTERLPAELQLLIVCARTVLDVPTAAQLGALVVGGPNWEQVLALARHHGVMPLLHRHLNGSDAVSAAVQEELARYARANALHNLSLAHALIDLTGALAQAGVEAVPYKGPVLAACTYGDLSLRASKDLDVIVRPADVRRADDVLASLGYIKTGRGPYHDLFVGATGVEVELHRDVLRRNEFPTLLDLGAMWGRRTTVSLLGRQVDAFGPEDTLLLLCLHGSKHLWSGLVWVCDVAEYLRAHPALDWARFIETAAQSRLLTAALLGPWLAHGVLDAPLSDDMQARVAADSLASRLGRTLVARWYQQPMTRHEALFSLCLRLRLHFGDAGLPLYSRLVKRVLKPQGVDYRVGGRLGAHLSRSLRLTRRLLAPADTARGPAEPPRGGRNSGSR